MIDPNSIQKDLKEKAKAQTKKLTRKDELRKNARHRDLSHQPSAGFFRRLLAAFIDIVICAAVAIFLDGFLLLILKQKHLIIFAAALFPIITLIPTILVGGSFGKIILGMKVIYIKTGYVVNPIQAILREFIGKTLSTACLGLGHLAMLFNLEKRAWHDRMFKTRVVIFKDTPY